MNPFGKPQPQMPIGIPRRVLEQNIELAKSKVELHQALLDAHIKRDLEERKFYYDIYSMLALASGRHNTGETIPEPKYLQAMKQFYSAHESIIRVQLSELQAQLKMYEDMLKEAERNVVLASGSVS